MPAAKAALIFRAWGGDEEALALVSERDLAALPAPGDLPFGAWLDRIQGALGLFIF